MSIRATILALLAIFLAFVLEHMPMPDLLRWLQPPWMLLMLTVLILNAPQHFGLWLAIPLGLMLDVENNQALGVHVITFALHIVLLQLMYRRLQVFHFLQLTVVVMLLVVLHQIVMYLAIALVSENRVPIAIWQPAFVSALIWPWLYALVYMSMKRLHLT